MPGSQRALENSIVGTVGYNTVFRREADGNEAETL
jgi:hypothetical protein